MTFPSEAQDRVIKHRGSPLVVIAGPGTGKTRTLVERMISLLREEQSREVSFVTFTRTSRRDTETKLVEALGEAVLTIPDLLFPRTSTFHQYAKRLVHNFAAVIGRDPGFSILVDSKGERRLILEELALDLGIAVESEILSDGLQCFRATGQWPPRFPLDGLKRIEFAFRFDEMLNLYKTFDMEGLVLAAQRILQAADAAVPQVFLQVDEYQDLNPSDQECVALLTSHKQSQVVVVGDDAQSIYGFRRANYAGIQALWAADGWQKVGFEDSHRMPAHVLNASLDLVADRGYLGANLHRKPEVEQRIRVLQCTTPGIQIEAIAKDISTKIAAGIEGAVSFRDFLVLCPTAAQAKQAEEGLRDAFDLPVRTPARATIPDDAWAVILVLRIAENDDPLALRQWLPRLGLGDVDVRRIRYEALNDRRSFSDACYSSADPRIRAFSTALDQVRRGAKMPGSLADAVRDICGREAPAYLDDFLSSQLKPTGELPALGALIRAFYEEYGILEAEEMTSDEDCILVATMHSAKGLEASHVYCAWMNSRFMPMEGRDPEEERRVLYVALTRAKRDVLLTFHESYDRVHRRLLGRQNLSPFLEEIESRLSIFRVTADAVRSNPPMWFG